MKWQLSTVNRKLAMVLNGELNYIQHVILQPMLNCAGIMEKILVSNYVLESALLSLVSGIVIPSNFHNVLFLLLPGPTFW